MNTYRRRYWTSIRDWTNIGDMNPENGTTLVKNQHLDDKGNFCTAAIVVTPEAHIGGRPNVFNIRQGEMFLSKRDINSALKVVDAKRDGNDILRPTTDMLRPGERVAMERIAMNSPDGLLELCNAVNAYGLQMKEYIDTLVQVGSIKSDVLSMERFDGPRIRCSENTSLWVVLRVICANFDNRLETDLKQDYEDVRRQVYDGLDDRPEFGQKQVDFDDKPESGLQQEYENVLRQVCDGFEYRPDSGQNQKNNDEYSPM